MSALNPLYVGLRTLAIPGNNVYDYYISPECEVRIMDNVYTSMDIPFDYSVEKKGEYLESLINRVGQLGITETNTSAQNIHDLSQAVLRKFRAHPDKEEEIIEKTLDSKRSTREKTNATLLRLGLSPIPEGTGRTDIRNNPYIQEFQSQLQEGVQQIQQQMGDMIDDGIMRAIAPPSNNCHDPNNYYI